MGLISVLPSEENWDWPRKERRNHKREKGGGKLMVIGYLYRRRRAEDCPPYLSRAAEEGRGVKAETPTDQADVFVVLPGRPTHRLLQLPAGQRAEQNRQPHFALRYFCSNSALTVSHEMADCGLRRCSSSRRSISASCAGVSGGS